MSNKAQSRGAEYERLLSQERFILEVTERLCEYMDAHHISRTELAQRLGKSKGFISQLLAGGRNLTLRTVADIAHALQVELRIQLSVGEVSLTRQSKVIWRDEPAFWRAGAGACSLPQPKDSNRTSEASDTDMVMAMLATGD